MVNLVPNGHARTQEIEKEKMTNDEPTKKQISVVCNLKQARWGQVSYLNSIETNYCLRFRLEHFLSKTLSLMLIQVISFVSLAQLELAKFVHLFSITLILS